MTNSTPIARLKGSRTLSQSDPRAALAFTFISSAELINSPGLLPPLSPIPVTHSPTLSLASGKRGSNYQHILLFDPEDGVLSLHQLTLEKHLTREPVMATVAASAQALGVMSISLPGIGGAGKLSSSPAAKPSHAKKVAESEMELGAIIHLVVTYNLKRGINWTSVSKPMGVSEVKKNINPVTRECVFLPFIMFESQYSCLGFSFLAEAELSTCSNSESSEVTMAFLWLS